MPSKRQSSKTPLSRAAMAKPRSGGKFIKPTSAPAGKTYSPGGHNMPVDTPPPVMGSFSAAQPRKTYAPQGYVQSHAYTGGKYVAGYMPQPVFGGRMGGAIKQVEDEDEDDSEDMGDELSSEYENFDRYGPGEHEEEERIKDEDEQDDYALIRTAAVDEAADSDFEPEEAVADAGEDDEDYDDRRPIRREVNATRGSGSGGGRRAPGPARLQGFKPKQAGFMDKDMYRKTPRKDSNRFTTTQAMIDADEEIHPKVAAFMGKKIVGKGNGRKGGRQLIRWTPATDQLLLLCFHHELCLIKDDLPYEAIAQRMFPEKCATGGAIKERFAKLRIEALNRGSWVPPILGKTPQGMRPNVRGVVRQAPGIEKGRYILWKEDASKLIDPKDINKGYNDAVGRGDTYPGRVWINQDARDEWVAKRKEMESEGMTPFKDIAVDHYEEASDDVEDADDVDDEAERIVDAPARFSTPKKRKAMNAGGLQAPVGKRQSTAKAQCLGKSILNSNDPFLEESPAKARGARKAKQKALRALDYGAGQENDLSVNHMADGSPVAFIPPKKRCIVILRNIPRRSLGCWPAGFNNGDTNDLYYADEVCAAAFTGECGFEEEEAFATERAKKHAARAALESHQAMVEIMGADRPTQNMAYAGFKAPDSPVNETDDVGVTLGAPDRFQTPEPQVTDPEEIQQLAELARDIMNRHIPDECLLPQVLDQFTGTTWSIPRLREAYRVNMVPTSVGMKPIDEARWSMLAKLFRRAYMEGPWYQEQLQAQQRQQLIDQGIDPDLGNQEHGATGQSDSHSQESLEMGASAGNFQGSNFQGANNEDNNPYLFGGVNSEFTSDVNQAAHYAYNSVQQNRVDARGNFIGNGDFTIGQNSSPANDAINTPPNLIYGDVPMNLDSMLHQDIGVLYAPMSGHIHNYAGRMDELVNFDNQDVQGEVDDQSMTFEYLQPSMGQSQWHGEKVEES